MTVERTPRDDRTFDWIGEQWCARTDALAYLLGGDIPLAGGRVRQVVGRWERAGWVRTQVAGGGPVRKVVWLAKREAERRGWGMWYAGGKDLRHRHACGVARLLCERVFDGAVWESERTLLREMRRASVPGEHVADGVLYLPGGGMVAVEVELAKKNRRLVQAAMQALDERSWDGRGFDGQLWLASRASRALVFKAAQLSGARNVTVLDLPDLEDVDSWPQWVAVNRQWLWTAAEKWEQ